MIIPYRVTTLTMRSPWANLALIASNVLMFVLTVGGALSDDLLQRLVLSDWSPLGFIGSQFLHAGIFHLAGNMIIGWFAWDLISALRHVPGIACWAHVGGTLAGFGLGVLLLKMGRIHIGDYDNPTVLDLFSRSRE